jgi:PEP-CTERM motif
MKLWKFAAAACTAGALALGSGTAMAGLQADVSVVGTNGAAAPGATAFTSLTISFAQIYNFIGVDLEGFYDTSKLTFNSGQSSVNLMGTSLTLAEFMTGLAGLQVSTGGDFQVIGAGVTGAGDMFLRAGFGAGSYALTPGDIVVTMAFDIKPSVAVNSVANITFTQFALTDVTPEMTPLATDDNRIILTVTAVPEPESWLMMLAGVGLLGAVARRRAARA